jgi:small subunit ribosomal protein S6
MTDYEITYILKPSLDEAEVEARSAAFSAVVTNNGGTIGSIEKLGKKRLAYEIADLREGSYVVMIFQSDAAAAKELERQMKLQEDVLRSLLVQLDKKALIANAVLLANTPPPVPPATAQYAEPQA